MKEKNRLAAQVTIFSIREGATIMEAYGFNGFFGHLCSGGKLA